MTIGLHILRFVCLQSMREWESKRQKTQPTHQESNCNSEFLLFLDLNSRKIKIFRFKIKKSKNKKIPKIKKKKNFCFIDTQWTITRCLYWLLNWNPLVAVTLFIIEMCRSQVLQLHRPLPPNPGAWNPFHEFPIITHPRLVSPSSAKHHVCQFIPLWWTSGGRRVALTATKCRLARMCISARVDRTSTVSSTTRWRPSALPWQCE